MFCSVEKRGFVGSTRSTTQLFLQDSFEPVAGKSADNKDDNEDDDLDKNAKYPKEPYINARASGDKIARDKHKKNPQDDTSYRTIPEETGIVFFPMMEKAESDPEN